MIKFINLPPKSPEDVEWTASATTAIEAIDVVDCDASGIERVGKLVGETLIANMEKPIEGQVGLALLILNGLADKQDGLFELYTKEAFLKSGVHGIFQELGERSLLPTADQ